MKKKLLILSVFMVGFVALDAQTVLNLSTSQPDVLQANAGNDANLNSGGSVAIGANPSATGGTEPYIYSWSNGTSDISTDANPLVSPEATTTYTLLVTDDSACTATDNITINIVTLGSHDFTDDDLRIFPNPATNMFTVDYAGEDGTISLFDAQGRQLWTLPLHGKTNFSAPGIPGFYFVKINAEGKESIREIVVSK